MHCTCLKPKNKPPKGYVACSSFGNGLTKSIAGVNGIEYPGMHRSLVFIFKTMLFYIDKIGYPSKFSRFSSTYRCWTDNMDASRHDSGKIRTTINHMGTALDIQFEMNGKTYNDIRRDIFCKYMGAPLKRWDGRDFGWTDDHVGLESTADGAPNWVHADVRNFHKYKDDKFFIKEERDLIPQMMSSLAKNLDLKIICSCNVINDSEFRVNTSDSNILYTLNDANEALEIIYNKYGEEMATIVEKMYRCETTHFTSLQYQHCGSPGMEVATYNEGNPPYYGWTLFRHFCNEYPEYKSVGTWSSMEGKGMSEYNGNSQDTKKPKHFVKLNSVLGAMEFLVYYINDKNGNYAYWYGGENVTSQNIYKKKLKLIGARIVDKLKKQ